MNEPIVQSMTSQLIVRFRERILAGTYAPGSALRPLAASELGEIFSLRLQIEPSAVARGAQRR